MRTLALIAFACGAAAYPARSQTAVTVDAGVSAVHYDGFLSSSAGSVTPAVRWEHPRGSLSARATYLRFESGRYSLGTSVNGFWLAPIARHWRGELGFDAGASDYANVANFSHGAVDARLHVSDAGRGGWIGAAVGRASLGAGVRPFTVVAAGAWLLRSHITLLASLDRSFVGDTTYSDLRSAARVQRLGVLFEAAVGARVLSRGGGRGVYGEGSATVPLGMWTALVLSAGRYPTDAVSGSIAGRYVTAALRLGTSASSQPAAHRLPEDFLASSHSHGSPVAPSLWLELQMHGDDVRLTVHASDAAAVDISGDFTDWRPVPLHRNPAVDGAWEGTFRMERGIHRVNVRRDGGPWIAPAGTTRTADDYDGEVGLFLLP
ncbi:MAG: hypothetical protein ABR537_11545 [Gemmatimonadales bacterium]